VRVAEATRSERAPYGQVKAWLLEPLVLRDHEIPDRGRRTGGTR
jgi:hypothetical protein